MGTSFVKYKEHGFWTRDEWLLDWLIEALREISKIKSIEEWQLEIGRIWDDTIVKGFPGGIDTRLDEILKDEERTRFVLGLSSWIGQSTLDPKVKRLAELFAELIEGKLKTANSSPIDYW